MPVSTHSHIWKTGTILDLLEFVKAWRLGELKSFFDLQIIPFPFLKWRSAQKGSEQGSQVPQPNLTKNRAVANGNDLKPKELAQFFASRIKAFSLLCFY